METALLSVLLKGLVPRLLSLVGEKYRMDREFKGDIKFLTRELPYITRAIDEQLSGSVQNNGHSLYLSDDELRQVAHDTEDCIDRIVYRACRKKQKISVKSGNKTKKKELAKEMKRLKKDIDAARERKKTYCVSRPYTPQLSHSSSSCHIPRRDLVGIDVPLEELREQLAEAEPNQLKVISIVGSRGLGKTALAWALYDGDVGKSFQERAWVSAAHGDPRVLLTEILQQLYGPPPLVNSDARQLSIDLRNRLNSKRYLIVIDDMQKDLWGIIESAFPTDIWSRVMVTTKFQSVANICSSNGYMHKMARLNQKHSKQLFLKAACPVEDLGYLQPDSAAILKKCDGQPLALTTVGQFMRKKRWPKGPDCEDVCKQVRYHLKTDDTLNRMHQMLIHDYSSLPSHDLKACLLYFAMFPSDRPVRTKRIIRQWLAEGFVQPEHFDSDPAAQNFEKLIDQNIIQPIDVSNNTKVKTCKTYGMMHEYILLKSVSENFIALLDDMRLENKYIRRLCLYHNSIEYGCSVDIDLSLVRCLIIFGRVNKDMLNFNKCQLLRVLDLEECTNLRNDDIKDVCKLLLLKYLSLGGDVTIIPKEIENLKLLETLDLRRTAVKILPPEVVQLPDLIHLFGKFKLSADKTMLSELQEFLASRKCKLKTLAGFVVDENEGFVELMGHMNKLRKVKVWCEPSATIANLTNLQEATEGLESSLLS